MEVKHMQQYHWEEKEQIRFTPVYHQVITKQCQMFLIFLSLNRVLWVHVALDKSVC